MSYVFKVTHDDVREIEDKLPSSISTISLDLSGCNTEASDKQFTIWTFSPDYNGGLHRGNDNPATIYENYLFLWHIYNIPHRINGPQRADFKHGDFSYALFGVNLEPIIFYNVQHHWREFKCPLWVSLFVVMDLVNEESFHGFLNENNVWECDLPIEWILKSFNVTAQEISDSLDIISFPVFWESIGKITRFMDVEQAMKVG